MDENTKTEEKIERLWFMDVLMPAPISALDWDERLNTLTDRENVESSIKGIGLGDTWEDRVKSVGTEIAELFQTSIGQNDEPPYSRPMQILKKGSKFTDGDGELQVHTEVFAGDGEQVTVNYLAFGHSEDSDGFRMTAEDGFRAVDYIRRYLDILRSDVLADTLMDIQSGGTEKALPILRGELYWNPDPAKNEVRRFSFDASIIPHGEGNPLGISFVVSAIDDVSNAKRVVEIAEDKFCELHGGLVDVRNIALDLNMLSDTKGDFLAYWGKRKEAEEA